MLKIKLKVNELRKFDSSDLLDLENAEQPKKIPSDKPDGTTLFVFDFDDTIRSKDTHEMLYTANIMRQRMTDGYKVIILTANPRTKEIKSYLEQNGFENIPVYSSQPIEKKQDVSVEVAKRKFMKSYVGKHPFIKTIYFYDDSQDNIQQMSLLNKFGIKVITHLVDNTEDQDSLTRK